MKNSVLFGGVAICALAGSAFGQNQPGLVVPGKSAGHLRIGSVLPARLRGQKPWAELVVQSNWVSVYSAPHGGGGAPTIGAIRFSAPKWKLAGGISTATPIANIRHSFPHLRLAATYRNSYLKSNVAFFEDASQGIAFEFLANKAAPGYSKCLGITVFKPRTLIHALLADPTLKPVLHPRAGA